MIRYYTLVDRMKATYLDFRMNDLTILGIVKS